METFNSSLTLPNPYASSSSSTAPFTSIGSSIGGATYATVGNNITDFGTSSRAATATNILNWYGIGGSSSGTSTGTTSPWMDSRIWSRLPQRLLYRVIAFLPPPAFFRARSVCKHWYSLPFSTSFLHIYLQVSPEHHYFLFFSHQPLSARTTSHTIVPNQKNHHPNGGEVGEAPKMGFLFDPAELVWYRLSFVSLPEGFSPAASSGGLICWVSDQASHKTIILCNPLQGLGQGQEQGQGQGLGQGLLPPTLRPRLCPSVGLAVGPSSIDVAVAGDDMISPYAVKNLTSEAFHVDAGGFYSIWGTGASLPRLCSLESGRMVCVEGRFYCMNYSPYGVLAYDVAANEWRKIQAPMRRFLRSPSLVESGGRGRKRLVLVAAVEKSKLNVPRSLRLWALQQREEEDDDQTLRGGGGGWGTWTEIERMPPHMYVEFAAVEGNRGFDCVGSGEYVMIVVRGGAKAVLFEFGSKRWRWVPPCPFLGVGQQQQLHGFSYEPRLATPVTGLLDHLTLPFNSFNP